MIVNRVWRWHFGRGLVSTTDNFGLTGDAPTHPQLLDHLATEFARDWSLKRLHRRIMLSAVYQTDSRRRPALQRADPDNRMLGCFEIQRLEAEQIRDAMLAVSGSLDRTPGGPVLKVKNREFLFNHTSKDETSYSNARRSVYLPVVRNHLYEAFTLFDYTDASVPNGNRSSSTVASQALYLMNSDFVTATARKLAHRLQNSAAGSDEERVGRLYELCYGRHATDAEIRRAFEFLEEFDPAAPPGTALQLLCQSVLMSNEFLYVR